MIDLEVSGETALFAALGGVILAIFLWILTNWNTVRVGRAIKADVDAKRAATEKFVQVQLEGVKASVKDQVDRLETNLGGFEARIHAELPPNVDGRVAELEGKLEAFQKDFADFAGALGRDLAQLPSKIGENLQARAASAEGVEQRAIQELAKGHEQEIESALSVQEALAAQDPEAMKFAVMKKVMDFKFTGKYAKEHPLIAAALEIGKPKIIEMVSEGLGTAGAPSVRLTKTSKGGGW